MATRYRHPVNRTLFENAPLGARIADLVTGFLGSWRFIVLQTVIVLIWLTGNIYLLSQPFDPYPFILLNLAFSTQAAYAAPLILLAGNRAAIQDRMTLEHAADEADIEEKQNNQLLASARESVKHLTELAERTLAIEQAIKAQGDQLLRLEQAILSFEQIQARATGMPVPDWADPSASQSAPRSPMEPSGPNVNDPALPKPEPS